MADITLVNHYANPSFNPKEEAFSYFTKETAEQYKVFGSQLNQLKYETETSLKESVFDHYTEFIGFSTEVQKMDDYMEQLKKNLNRTHKVIGNLKEVSLTIDVNEEISEQQKTYIIPENIAWIKTVNDDIDLFIFQRRFSEAVDLCARAQNELNAIDTSTNPLLTDLKVKLASKAELLTSKLVSELFAPDSTRTDRRRICRLLCGLGHDREACVLYLQRTSEEINTHHRLVKPCGDIPSLIAGLSELFFECLQDTVVNFQALFGSEENKAVFSICVSWLTKEIDRFVRQVVLLAVGETDATSMTVDGFANFAACVTPLLQGARIVLSDVGCCVDSFIVQSIGDRVKSSIETVFMAILIKIKSLPAPESVTSTVTFRSSVGLEKRTLSTHAATVYSESFQFFQCCGQLLEPSLLEYVAGPLEKGLAAFCAHEIRVYELWLKEKDSKRQPIIFTDLYFLNTELVPTLTTLLVPKLGHRGTNVAQCLNNFKTQLRTQTMVLMQIVCIDVIAAMKFAPTFYISQNTPRFLEFLTAGWN